MWKRYFFYTFLVLQIQGYSFAADCSGGLLGSLQRLLPGNSRGAARVDDATPAAARVDEATPAAARASHPESWNSKPWPVGTIQGNGSYPARIFDEVFYGHNSLNPDEVFANGLLHRGSNTDLFEHTAQLDTFAPTSYRGSTQTAGIGYDQGAKGFAGDGGYVYNIANVPGWDANVTLQGRVQNPDGSFRGNTFSEGEIIIPSEIPSTHICYARLVMTNARITDRLDLGPIILNPNADPRLCPNR